MPEIIYRTYVKADEDAVLDHILAIQQGEFAVPVTPEEQPDLRAVAEVYQSGTGGFWVAEWASAEGVSRIVGTIGLIGFGDRQGALRKMFVAAEARGRELGVGARLLALLVDHARAQGLKAITLGTIERQALRAQMRGPTVCVIGDVVRLAAARSPEFRFESRMGL